jgi:hypothetical protein
VAAADSAAAAPAGGGDAAFEGLVDQVEQSLQPGEAPAAAATPAAAETASTPAATADTMLETATAAGNEKSDADLVAEFEKMLNN